jgi:chromate transporter
MPSQNPSKSATLAPAQPHVPLPELLGIFLRVGILAIGGGAQAYMHREIVEQRGWLDDKAYLTGLAIAQVLPGANPVNLALYVGHKLRGSVGAALAVFGMVIPAFCIILAMGFTYRQFAGHPVTHSILMGVAAVGVAATLSVGIKVSRSLERSVVPIVTALITFGTIGVLRWPMVPVVLVMVPLSILLAYAMERRDVR